MSKPTFYVGEGLAGEGNEVAHIDLILGSKEVLGEAFANTLSRQSAGHSNLLAVLAPNKAVKPDTVTFTKVTIKNAAQAVQMFGPAQSAVSWAVADALSDDEFKDVGGPDNLCIIVGVFIHWEAKEDAKIFAYNYEATRMAIRRAVTDGPSVDEVKKWASTVESDKSLAHPFTGKDVDLGKTLAELRKKFPKQTS